MPLLRLAVIIEIHSVLSRSLCSFYLAFSVLLSFCSGSISSPRYGFSCFLCLWCPLSLFNNNIFCYLSIFFFLLQLLPLPTTAIATGPLLGPLPSPGKKGTEGYIEGCGEDNILLVDLCYPVTIPYKNEGYVEGCGKECDSLFLSRSVFLRQNHSSNFLTGLFGNGSNKTS